MKSYEEMSNNILNKYENKKKQIRSNTIAVVSTSLCLIFAFALFANNRINTPKFANEDMMHVAKSLDVECEGVEDVVIFNKLDGAPKTDLALEPCFKKGTVYQEFSKEDLVNYYGIDIFPEVNFDMKLVNEGYGIYVYDGNVVYDWQNIKYANYDYSKMVSNNVCKKTLNMRDWFILGENDEPSSINGVDVYLYEGEQYTGVYDLNGTHVELTANGISEEEFINIIKSLIK